MPREGGPDRCQLLSRLAKRLFDKDMLAVGQGADDLCGMIPVIAGDRDDVDLTVVEQRLGAVVDAQVGVVAARGLALGRIDVGDGDDIAIGMTTITGDVPIADSEPDNAGAQARHQLVSSGANNSASSIASLRTRSSSVSTESCSVGRATRATRLRMRKRSGCV